VSSEERPLTTDAAPEPAADGAGSKDHVWTRGRRWAEAERTRVEGALQVRREHSSIIDAGFKIQDLDADVGGGILAGAVAFRLFLFMVPFVYIVFTLLGLAARTANEDPSHLARTIGITGVLASAVVSSQDLSAWTQFVLLCGAAVALLLTARSLTKTLFVVHWLVWRIQRVRPHGSHATLLVIGLGLVFTALGVGLNDVRRAGGLAGALAIVVLIAGVAFAAWWWTTWRLPHPDVPVTTLIPGAVLMAVGLLLLHLLTTYWIGHLVARKSNTYGAVGIALAVLFWVYILGRIIVGAVGLDATLWYQRQARHPAPATDATTPSAPDPGVTPAG
jgi:uncharacterized BrkB/YihY/UPF0761 family membrane protein